MELKLTIKRVTSEEIEKEIYPQLCPKCDSSIDATEAVAIFDGCAVGIGHKRCYDDNPDV